jgi:putative two-component system response regulator
MRELLSRKGYRVEIANNAQQAERLMFVNPPDLVLLDVIMPGKTGYELCREWKQDPATRLIPIVMITGLSDREDKIRGIEAGADEFLNKPIFPEELFARVGSLLRVKEYTDELENAEAVLCTLGLSVESRDPYTEGHCERLARYASDLGSFLGLTLEQQVALRRGGYLHTRRDTQERGKPDSRRLADHEATSGDWGIHMQAIALAATRAAHHSSSS